MKGFFLQEKQGNRLPFSAEYYIILNAPVWWNWQTRWTQNPVVVIPYRFDPDHRHQRKGRKMRENPPFFALFLYFFRQSEFSIKCISPFFPIFKKCRFHSFFKKSVLRGNSGPRVTRNADPDAGPLFFRLLPENAVSELSNAAFSDFLRRALQAYKKLEHVLRRSSVFPDGCMSAAVGKNRGLKRWLCSIFLLCVLFSGKIT